MSIFGAPRFVETTDSCVALSTSYLGTVVFKSAKAMRYFSVSAVFFGLEYLVLGFGFRVGFGAHGLCSLVMETQMETQKIEWEPGPYWGLRG